MPQVDYSKIVIYKIQHQSKDELLYVGSTTHFRNRKVQHKSRCYNANDKVFNTKLYTTIRDNGGWNAFNMVVVKEFPCKNKQEALTEEDRIMREMRSSLNMYRAYTTPEEKQQYQKEYEKDYREQNIDKIKEYREQNRDKMKEYYEQNRDKLKEQNKKRKEEIKCECGCIIRKNCLSRHKRSIKHQTFINQQTEQ